MDTQITISGIVLIVSLIVPGVIFKRFYFQGQFSKQFGAGLFADRLITSIFWGLFVQVIAFVVYSRALGFTFTNIHKSINKVYHDINTNVLPDLTYKHLYYILGYLFTLILVAAVLGHTLHKIIRLLKIDLHSEAFRFANEWHYYFTGEILSTKDFKSAKKGKVLSTLVDILIEDGTEKNKMVSGFLTNYIISSKTGELESIHLTSAQRYSQTTQKFKDVPGDCLIVPYSKVTDINIRYNIQVIDKSKRKQVVANVVATFGLAIFLLFLSFPWFLEISLNGKLLAVVLLVLDWTFLMVLISNPFQSDEKKLKGGAYLLAALLFIILGFCALIPLKLL